MSDKLSPNAERALLFQYVLAKGLPEWAETNSDPAGAQLKIFGRISGLGEAEVAAAYAELEDAGMIDRDDLDQEPKR